MTIITLFVIGGISLVLLIAGEALVNTLTVLVSALVSFMGFLYLWQWACSSTVSPMEGFVKCILPFILACLCALLIAIAIAMLIKKFTSLVFFIMGAGGGAVGMFLLRQVRAPLALPTRRCAHPCSLPVALARSITALLAFFACATRATRIRP